MRADTQSHWRPGFPHRWGWLFGRGEGTAPLGPRTSHTEIQTWPDVPDTETEANAAGQLSAQIQSHHHQPPNLKKTANVFQQLMHPWYMDGTIIDFIVDTDRNTHNKLITVNVRNQDNWIYSHDIQSYVGILTYFEVPKPVTMTEHMACTLDSPLKHFKHDMCKYNRFQTKERRKMRLPLFLYLCKRITRWSLRI